MEGQVLTACRTITSLQMAVMSIRHPPAKKAIGNGIYKKCFRMCQLFSVFTVSAWTVYAVSPYTGSRYGRVKRAHEQTSHYYLLQKHHSTNCGLGVKGKGGNMFSALAIPILLDCLNP